jgi:hypothetical protein
LIAVLVDPNNARAERGRKTEAIADLRADLSLDPGQQIRDQIVAALARLGA